MNRLDLSEDDLFVLQKCLNDGTEPPAELAKKLSPSLYATFDFKTLKDSKIPAIEYAGKRPEAAILNEASAFGGGSPLQLERYFEGGKISKRTSQLDLFEESKEPPDSNWRNLIVQGDNLQFLKTCYLNQDPIIKDKVKGKVRLIYIDPPFGTGDEYGGSSGEISYSAKVAGSEFIEGIRERLIFLRELLADDGCIFVRLDYHFGHYIKVVLDEVFSDNFKNEMIVNRIYKNVFGDSKFIPTSTDSLFVYSKKEKYLYKNVKQEMAESREAFWRHMDDSDGVRKPIERIVFGKTVYPPASKHFKYNQKAIDKMLTERRIRFKCSCGYTHDDPAQEWRGCPECGKDSPKLQYLVLEKNFDNLQSNWTDIPGYSSSTGYPTENSEVLLERVISIASGKQDLVMDVFGGSGTTAAVSEKLDRRWIVCDFGKHAIYIMQKRMCQIADSQKLGNQRKKKEKYGEAPKPFCVVSVGAFDFQKIMNLRKNRDAYISFVMGIFGLTERDDKLAAKYRVNNVCTLKEGNPVEIYPVWDDEFLRNVRVDEEYLRGILAQSGGNLKGDYYIAAPETCVRVGETQMKTTRGDRVTFKPLTFPYKVLEEVARNFTIEDQPSSPDNINKLISSVGFYFNETVEVDIKKISKGLKISRFTTSILDSKEKRYEGLEGLAMLLIDSDYDEDKGFTVDTVIYQNDIKDNEASVGGLTNKSAVIAIDKHGNESGVIKVR